MIACLQRYSGDLMSHRVIFVLTDMTNRDGRM